MKTMNLKKTEWTGVATLFFSEYCCENKVEGIQGDRYRRYAAGFFKKYFSHNGLNPHNLMKMEEIPFLSVLNVAVRNSLFDRCVQNLIDRDPGRTVVNIGCGFDTRYFRLRGYRGLYYDVDYVKVIGLKKRLFRRFNPSCHFTGVRDAFTDRFWKRELVLDRDNPVIVCEGVFCYIPYRKVVRFVEELFERYPKATLICDVYLYQQHLVFDDERSRLLLRYPEDGQERYNRHRKFYEFKDYLRRFRKQKLISDNLKDKTALLEVFENKDEKKVSFQGKEYIPSYWIGIYEHSNRGCFCGTEKKK